MILARRPELAERWFSLAAAIAASLLLGLGAGLTFFSDEWAFIESRSLGDASTWFVPHNEHWATLQVLAYRALVETVGLRSYVPYLITLIALHLLVAGLVYVLVRREAGPWTALLVGIVFLVFGAGFENLYWAFQIGFVGALAAGLGAILVFDSKPLGGWRAFAGAALLLASLATQGGIGVVCSVAVAIELALDPARRRAIIALAPPGAAYALWYLTIGRIGVEAHQGLFSLGSVDVVLAVMAIGWSTTIGAITGLGPQYGGWLGAATVIGFAGWSLYRRRLRLAPRFVGCVVAVTSLYALIGLARSFVGPDVAQYTRYTYVAAALVLVGLASQIGRPSLDTPVHRRAWVFAGAGLMTLALAWNLRLLLAGRELFFERTELTRAFVTVALERPLPASTDPARILVIIPSPVAMEGLVARYGSPLSDIMVPGAVRPIRQDVLTLARSVLAEGAEIPLPDQ